MALLLHPTTGNVQPGPIRFSTEYESRTLTEDREIVERIIAAYHQALSSASEEVRRSMCGTIWGPQGYDERQSGLIRALEEKSPGNVHEILRRFHVSDAAHGLGMGKVEADTVGGGSDPQRAYGLLWLDRLVGLAEATGALPLPNPEDNADDWQRCLEVDPEAVVAAIEKHIGIALDFPDVTGVFGGELRGRPFPVVAFTHLLMALSVRPWLPPEDPIVVEIGGGWGGLAYWTKRLTVCRYTIYDLPFASAAQAYFLWRALPGAPLRLAGEPEPGPGETALLPAWDLVQRPPQRADAVVNQDSLAEIPRAVASAYLGSMRGFLRGPFLSVNHESGQRFAYAWDRTSVAQLVERAGGYVRISRAPFPLRLGYVQEIYCPTSVPLLPPTLMGAVVHSAFRRARGRLGRAYRRLLGLLGLLGLLNLLGL